MYTDLDFSQRYPYLQMYQMSKALCDQLFKNEDITWMLTTTPCNGFYVNLLAYQKSNYPSLTNREVGTLMARIDPQLAATMNLSRPENVFKKVHRISLRKREMDSLVFYMPSKYT